MTHRIFGFEMVQWARYSFAAKSIECSTRGGQHYSAMTVRLSDGRTIEQHYHCDVKGFEPGGYKWRKGKGKPPVNGKGRAQLMAEYIALWARYADENPGYIEELSDGLEQAGITFLTDCFANTEINSAHALSVLVNAYRQRKAMSEHDYKTSVYDAESDYVGDVEPVVPKPGSTDQHVTEGVSILVFVDTRAESDDDADID